MLVGLAKASAIYVSGFIVMDFRVAAIRNENYREKKCFLSEGKRGSVANASEKRF